MKSKLLRLVCFTGAGIITGLSTPAAFAGGYHPNEETYQHSSGSCHGCNLTLPATSSTIQLQTPSVRGTSRRATTTSRSYVTVENTHHWEIKVIPTGVESKVINVQTEDIPLPCTTCAH